MKRILIANGAFSSLVLSSIIKHRTNPKAQAIAPQTDNNFLLGYFKNVSAEKAQELFNFCNLVIPTSQNINFFDYKEKLNFNLSKLHKALGLTDVDEIDEIYIPLNSSTKKIHKTFKAQYPNASFIFYEEGLMSYIKPLFDKNLRKIMESSENHYLFYDEKLKNLLTKSFPKISFKTIAKSNFLDNIKIVQNTLPPFVELKAKNKYALVLPQYYHQGNSKKTAEVLAMYEENIKSIIERGYKVIFKDHPKAKLKYSTTLKQKFSPTDFLLFEDLSSGNLEVYPVEVVANILKIDMVFSVYSTSLFTFKHLFNIPTYSSYKMLDERMNFWSIYPTFSALITKNIINNLFDNSKNTNELLYTENKILKILVLVLKFIHKYKN